MKITSQKGQAVLIILLVMVVILTVALSIASRSITDISISKKEEEAARAFSAAEAGVEQALKGTNTADIFTGSFQNEASFSASVTSVSSGGATFVYPSLISSGETATVWFISHANDGSLTCSGKPCFAGSKIKVCWGVEGTDASTAITPAIEFSVLYDSSGIKIARGSYDPYATRRASNNFAANDGSVCTINGQNFAFYKTVELGSSGLNIPSTAITGNGLKLAKIRLLYNTDKAHLLGIEVGAGAGDGNFVLPEQGQKIESVGTAGDSSRKIEAYKLYSDLPPVFDFGVFSGTGDLVK